MRGMSMKRTGAKLKGTSAFLLAAALLCAAVFCGGFFFAAGAEESTAESDGSEDETAEDEAESAGSENEVAEDEGCDFAVPEIEIAAVTFDENGSETEAKEADGAESGFYSEDIYLKITVYDSDEAFDPDGLTIEYAAADSSGNEVTYTDDDGNVLSLSGSLSADWQEDDESGQHTGLICIDKDANYTIIVSYTNTAGLSAEGDGACTFTVDKENPYGFVTAAKAGSDAAEGRWEELAETLTFKLFGTEETIFGITAFDDTSGVSSGYFVCSISGEDEAAFNISEDDGNVTALTAAELDEVNFTDGDSCALDADTQAVVYFKMTDQAGNVAYISSDGYVIDSAGPQIDFEIYTADGAAASADDIFNGDVFLLVTVDDEDENGSYSGIEEISYVITAGGEETASEAVYKTTDSGGEPQGSYGELVPSFEFRIDVDSAVNNSSDVTVTINAVDNAGNESELSAGLDIDITAPSVSVSYDNNAVVNYKNSRGYFNKTRTATVVITEREKHFDADDATGGISITAVDADGNAVKNAYTVSAWEETKGSSANGDDAAWTATIKFLEDANYTFSISYADEAGNESDDTCYAADTEAAGKFTVDTTPPRGTVTATSKEGEEQTWSSLKTKLTFGFYSRGKITVTGTSSDETSPVKSVRYCKVSAENAADSTILLTKGQLSEVTSWKKFSQLAVRDEQQFVIYLMITDYAGNVTYISTDGLIVDESGPGVTVSPQISISSGQPANGIYSDDVEVYITVADQSSGGTYSGIALIRYEVLNMGEVTQSGTLYKFTKSNPAQSSLKKKWTGSITVDSALNNSNDVEIIVYASDNAGNLSDASKTIKIDVTKPSVSVSYDNNQAESDTYFNAGRTATITITERNFDADDVDIDITSSGGVIPDVSGWKKSVAAGNGDATTWVATVTFSGDGDYTFDICCVDDAGNKAASADYGSSVAPTKFTIDGTAPDIAVSFDNNSASNSKYFNASRTMTITITERNFDADRVQITQTAALAGASVAAPDVTWASDGDLHIGTIVYDCDGDYTFEISMTDLAGNENGKVDYGSSAAAEDFTIDLTIGKSDGAIISGVKNGKAYGYDDDVIFSVNFSDVNFLEGSAEICLLRTRKDEIREDVTEEFLDGLWAEKSTGISAVFDVFERVRENDGIYTLTVSCEDLAGNKATESVTFTINRFGSVYAYSGDLAGLTADGGAYVRSVDGMELVITEYNDTRLEEGSLKIAVTRDGKPIDDVDVTVSPVINRQAKTGESGWYEYEYVLDTGNFAGDGVYKISITSEDEAGNTSVNTGSGCDEIIFRVDTTAPQITSVSGLEEVIVNDVALTVSYTVYDTIGMESIEIFVSDSSGKIIDEIAITEDDFGGDLNNYSGEITLNEMSLPQSVRIVVTDKAGNVTDTGSDGFSGSEGYEYVDAVTVSTNFLVRWFANKPLFIGSLIGLVAAAGLIIFLIMFFGMRNERSGTTGEERSRENRAGEGAPGKNAPNSGEGD